LGATARAGRDAGGAISDPAAAPRREGWSAFGCHLMEAPVIAAFITGTAAVVGPVITYYATKRLEGRADESDPAPGLDIRGRWSGTGQDLSTRQPGQRPGYSYEILAFVIEGRPGKLGLSPTSAAWGLASCSSGSSRRGLTPRGISPPGA
jgi:hypothetical protein